MRLQFFCIGWVCALAVMWGSSGARAEPQEPIPATSPLAQMSAAAELLADIDPLPEHVLRRELQTAVRAELRSMVRSEVQSDLRPARARPAHSVLHGDNSAGEKGGGNVAAASEAAAQAQQARRNQDVAAARAKGMEHASLTHGNSQRPSVR